MTVLHPLTPHHAAHSLIPSISSFRPAALPSTYSIDSLKAWYLNPATDPLHPAIAFSIATSVIVFILGEVTGALSHSATLSR